MVAARTASTRWLVRIIPLVLAGCAGLATYVVVKRVCLDYFLQIQPKNGVAAAFLALYFFFLLLMLLSYFRVFLEIQQNPGVTPLGERAVQQREQEKERKRLGRKGGSDLEAGERYEACADNNPDSPGLERFYSKDVFVCNTDGRPRWCSSCCTWKVDRAHHCSELERCVKKMDHYCPWVGGVVGETSFKFFIQFTSYTALYCIVVIVATVICLKSKLETGRGVDGLVIAALAISAFFGLFTFTMTATSIRYAIVNLTNVDYLKSENIVHQLAIRVPRGTQATPNYSVVTYPLPKSSTPDHEEDSPRDQLATRTFAIVKTEMGENPWDLGPYRNWKSIMGNNPIDWLLPIKPSPCAVFENNESFYEMGPLYQQLRRRFGLPELPKREEEEILELKQQQHENGTNST
ncbi:DHHC palmitoyltransferase-domain-containing protein [Apiosordaria backusii]|uniref:Palmitoyltransferase n=1 Tax=Apiosordaria backusii TaxID=314023 RepID=A0AA40AXE7_9PEZI|nr:DHHC palmitoyltransferase-domain-containing protein [Apiosordaria backusii]